MNYKELHINRERKNTDQQSEKKKRVEDLDKLTDRKKERQTDTERSKRLRPWEREGQWRD